ncbi:MAG: copper chaperone PCu(A)C [Gammaproteobacteria bacterium]
MIKYLLPLLALHLGFQSIVLADALPDTDNGLIISNVWVREAPPGAAMLAAYLTIENQSDKGRELEFVVSKYFSHVMMHKSEVIDGVAKMLHQDKLSIPAHGKLELKPGGFHLMMPAPEKALEAGDTVYFRLYFANGESLPVKAIVKRAGIP